jgi:hypothetical protein
MEAVVADRPGEVSQDEAPSPGGAEVPARTATGVSGWYWFPLLAFGGLAALSVPLSRLGAPPPPPTGISELGPISYPTLTQATYFGGGSATGPFPFPLGWYWVAVLVAGSLLTAAWYRRLDRRAHSRTPLGRYLATGLGLAAVTAALPLLAWRQPALTGGTGITAWTWLDVFWQLGTFALLSVAVGLGMLAWIGRSRALAVVTAVYTAAVCLVCLKELRDQGPASFFAPAGDPAALLPAAILMLAGLGAMLAASRNRRNPSGGERGGLFRAQFRQRLRRTPA